MYMQYSTSQPTSPTAEERAKIRATLDAFVLPGSEKGSAEEIVLTDEVGDEIVLTQRTESIAPEPLSEALRLDLSTSVAALEHAGYHVTLATRPQGQLTAEVKRVFVDVDSFVAFARATALPQSQKNLAIAPNIPASSLITIASTNRVVAKPSPRRMTPWLIVLLMAVLVTLLLSYPWQQ